MKRWERRGGLGAKPQTAAEMGPLLFLLACGAGVTAGDVGFRVLD